MHIQDKHLRLIQEILQKYPYAFYAFGSRVTGKAREFSDLDLCFFENIPLSKRLQLKEEFEESDLPFTVDLVHFDSCDPSFQTEIMKNLECVQKS